MIRQLCVACVLLACLTVPVREASAQADRPTMVGGGLGWNFDLQDDYLLLTGVGRLPVEGPNIVFKPMVLSPRVSKYLGFGHWQFDADMLWDIPLSIQTNIKPYIGMGVGAAIETGFGDTEFTPLLNFDTGLLYAKPGWRHQLAIELHYSSGLDYGNTMVANLTVLFPFGGN